MDLMHPIELLKEEFVARADAIKKISNVSEALLFHTFKCLIATDERLFHHWVDEIDSYFTAIQLIELKPRGFKPSYKLCFTYLYEWYCGADHLISNNTFLLLRRTAIKKYTTGLDMSINNEQLRPALKEFYGKYCNVLSATVVQDLMVKETLLELRNKFSLAKFI